MLQALLGIYVEAIRMVDKNLFLFTILYMNFRRDSEIIANAIMKHDAKAVELIMNDISSDIGDDFVDVRDVDDDTWLINYEDYKNITLLELAVRVNDPIIARYLCDNYTFSIWTKDLFTPLHVAVQLGYADVAKELVRSKVFNPFQPAYDYPYETPFDIALKNDHIELAKWFLEYVIADANEKLQKHA
jgi:ankyrin repeat protein